MRSLIRWGFFALVILVTIGAVAQFLETPREDSTTIMVMRDSNELRFTNEGPDELHNCTVTIDGNYSALLRELPVNDRKFLVRAQFSGNIPSDEFYVRALRSTTMACSTSDGYGGTRPAIIRLK